MTGVVLIHNWCGTSIRVLHIVSFCLILMFKIIFGKLNNHQLNKQQRMECGPVLGSVVNLLAYDCWHIIIIAYYYDSILL